MPINRRNPGLAPRPERGGPKASPTPSLGQGSPTPATKNKTNGPNRSNAAYNSGQKKWEGMTVESQWKGDHFNAPTSTRNAFRSSEAHKHSSLEGIGGSHGDAIGDQTPASKGGLDSKRGSQSHGGSALSKENIRPDSAHEHSGFGDIGGCVKAQ